MKMVAPAEIGHFVFDNVEYRREGEDDTFDIKHPDHIAAARQHGAVEFDPNAPNLGLGVEAPVERVQSDHDAVVAAKDDEIAALKRQLEAATPANPQHLSNEAIESAKDAEIAALKRQLEQARETPPPVAGAAGTEGGAAATEHTSETLGGTTTTVPPQGQALDNLDKDDDKRAALIENKPDTNDYDAMKAWLKDAGVAVPGNISKARAKEVVEETVKDIEAGLAEAAKARQEANGTSTDADSTTH